MKNELFSPDYGKKIINIIDMVLMVSNSKYWFSRNNKLNYPTSSIRYQIEFIPTKARYVFNTTVDNTSGLLHSSNNLFDPLDMSGFKLVKIFVETNDFILKIVPRASCLKINGNKLDKEAISYWSWSFVCKETGDVVEYPIKISPDESFNLPLEAQMLFDMDFSYMDKAYQKVQEEAKAKMEVLKREAEVTWALKKQIGKVLGIVTLIPKFSHLKAHHIEAFVADMLNKGSFKAEEINFDDPTFNYKFFNLLGKNLPKGEI